MGRRTRLRGNPTLAKDHAAGATVIYTQNLVHDPWGGIAYHWPFFWDFEKHLTNVAADELKQLQQEVFDIPLGTSNTRTITNLDLLVRIYGAGADMVSHAVRSVQYLAQSMESWKDANYESEVATERLRKATELIGLNNHQSDAGYQGLTEMLRVRNAIEHPKGSTIYQGDPGRWDEVPLAWMISDRGLKAYERYSSWFVLLAADWSGYCEAHPMSLNLDGLVRGVESIVSSKKPTKK
ncbi:MAG: hypothetical protein Q8K48_03610 [Candidatus Planktophila sp.]|nr:hypothetical protein [Candidatus Planktophila sp.]